MAVTPIPTGVDPAPLAAATIDPAPIDPAEAARLAGDVSLFSGGELRLTAVIFIFGLIALLGFGLIVRSGNATPFIMRIYVVIILVFGTLLVVSSAYTTSQIAPVVGFFGTIAGYLLGRSEPKSGAGSDDD